MDIKKIKLISLVFFVLTLVFIFSSTYFYVKLEDQKADLVMYKDSLEIMYREVALQKASLNEVNIIDSQSSDKIGTKEQQINNSIYKIGINAVNNSREAQLVNRLLSSLNYNVQKPLLLREMPTWFYQNGYAIFYYSKGNKVIADQLKKDLDSLLNTNFKVLPGAGTGVSLEERPIKFNIHLPEVR